MRKTVKHNGTEYHIITNGHLYELKALAELPQSVREHDFDYVDDADYDEWSPRFFCYRGEWYDTHQFERGSHDIKAMGYDDCQTQSSFNCVAIGYFDKEGYPFEDAVRVAYIHW
jgi:hypothetical protein